VCSIGKVLKWKVLEPEPQWHNDVHRMFDDPRRTLAYIGRKSMVDNLDAIKVSRGHIGESLHYMILAGNVFRHEMRLLETLVPLTFLEMMVYSGSLYDLNRCTWL